MPRPLIIFSDKQMDIAIVDLEQHGLSLRNINTLEEIGCLYIGEALGLRYETILRAMGFDGFAQLTRALSHLRGVRNEKEKRTEIEEWADREPGSGK